MGHSQCGGIQALLSKDKTFKNDFISNWVSIIDTDNRTYNSVDECAKCALQQSYQNCLSFPWIAAKIQQKALEIHLWFFDIESGQIFTYVAEKGEYQPLDADSFFK